MVAGLFEDEIRVVLIRLSTYVMAKQANKRVLCGEKQKFAENVVLLGKSRFYTDNRIFRWVACGSLVAEGEMRVVLIPASTYVMNRIGNKRVPCAYKPTFA